ncbi:PHP domain-containing protein [Candidatus Bathyarchaeota archaeon]|nr:PHP domain-containing protein [Candidatus Bathyarchaeota archaeon]MBS7613645.1 PHP domain-containing protein [Candidatus Bathyarchaeota archaeon]MBS7617593.1 PHP domain-containing protein [Candidatus Bathyarchaeota archaeon]
MKWPYTPLPKTDIHTHSEFSKCSVNTTVCGNITMAVLKGLEAIAITDHTQHVLKVGFEKYIEKILRLRESNSTGLKVLTGLEVDIKLDGEPDVSRRMLRKLDVVIGALHNLPYGKSFVESYRNVILKALRSNWIDVLAHPTYVDEQNINLPIELIYEICEEARENSVVVELNSNHKCPSDEFIKICVDTGVTLTPVSDSHILGNIGAYDWQLQTLKRLNVLNDVKWLTVDLLLKKRRKGDF